MVNEVLNFISYYFSTNPWLAVFIVSMLPIAEAKVAIPFGMAKGVWGIHALSPSVAALVSFVGSMIPAIFIILFLRPIFEKLKKTKLFKNLILKLEGIFKKKSEKEISVKFFKRKKQNEASSEAFTSEAVVGEDGLVLINAKNNESEQKKEMSNFQRLVTLVFFVALPLPLAGVWTSSAIAAFTNTKFWPGLFAIAFGNLLEVLFITVICTLFIDSVSVVLIATVVLLVVYLLVMFILGKKKKKLA